MPYKDKKDKIKYDKQYSINNKEHKEQYRLKRKVKKARQDKLWKLKSKYGISHEEWLEMWEDQDGKCIICGDLFTKPSDACVDHNHLTGKVRKLLCMKCNTGLGFFKDSPLLLKSAMEYLLCHK